MYQTFDHSVAGSTSEHVPALRAWLVQADVNAVLIPRSDEHQSEYVPAGAERLHWLTGFSGSAGMAVVARRRAALFVDGRYTVQAANQVDTSVFEIVQIPKGSLTEWLPTALPEGGTVGFD